MFDINYAEVVKVYQYALMIVCLCGLGAIGIVSFLHFFGGTIERVWKQYLHLDGFGKAITMVCVVGLTMYGGSKGFWGKVAHGGGDAEFEVCGIYCAMSNIVETVDGEEVETQVPYVRIEWLGDGADENTPVSIRETEADEWAELVKLNPELTVENGTNALVFATAEDKSRTAYWWFGVDLPAIIVTEEGIVIKSYSITSKRVSFSWLYGEETATEFYIRRREVGTTEWELVDTVPAQYGVVNTWTGEMFTVNKSYDWQIMTEIAEE